MSGGKVSEDLFERGLCLPSGTRMTEEDLVTELFSQFISTFLFMVMILPDLLFKSPRDFCTMSYLSLRARLRRTTKQSHNTLIITEIATAQMRLAMTESEFFKVLNPE